jgi:Domain of unknown function (DUF1905)
VHLEFRGEITYWRGPSPFHFIAVPDDGCREIHAISSLVTYGWGVIPVTARIGGTEWTTSLFPKDGGYLVPIKDAVRLAEGLALGDEPTIDLTIEGRADPYATVE